MTPYRERREKGEYAPKGQRPTQSTTTSDLSGLGAAKTEKKQTTKK